MKYVKRRLYRAQPHASSYLASQSMWGAWAARTCEAAAHQARHTSSLVLAKEKASDRYAYSENNTVIRQWKRGGNDSFTQSLTKSPRVV